MADLNLVADVAKRMADRLDREIEAAMGCTFAANTAQSDQSLTLECLLKVMDSIPQVPPAPKYDLFGQSIDDRIYELPEPDVPMIPGSAGRRLLVVPDKDKLLWFKRLCDAGIDVRLEPRIRRPDPESTTTATGGSSGVRSR